MSSTLQPPRPVRSLPVRSGATQLSRVAAVQFLLGFVGAERVLGRVAAAAMAEAVDQIGAAIPFRRLAGVGLEIVAVEEEQVPRPSPWSGN